MANLPKTAAFCLNTSSLFATPWIRKPPDEGPSALQIFRFHFGDIPTVGLTNDDSSRHISGSATDKLHVDDTNEACLLLLEKFSEPAEINIGVGEDLTINYSPARSLLVTGHLLPCSALSLVTGHSPLFLRFQLVSVSASPFFSSPLVSKRLNPSTSQLALSIAY